MATRLPWWSSGRTMRDLLEELSRLWTARLTHPKPNPTVQQRWAVDFVLLSCKLEQTVPASLSREEVGGELEETYLRCQEEDYAYCLMPASAPWPSDGSPHDLAANKRQLVQHMKALCYICSVRLAGSSLDAAVLRKTHSILLNNATDDSGIPLPAAGVYRTHPASTSSGKLYFSNADDIARTVEEEMIRYTSSSNSGVDQIIEGVARLFYGLIMAHPFTDGNGRVCRLLIASALMREGVPFPMLMHNGHKKYRLHYMSVTQHAFDHGNTDRLQCYVLECLLFWWTKLAIGFDM